MTSRSLYPGYQAGQSLPEFAVGMLVLVPLFLGVMVIGKLSDTNAYVTQGARYQAWEKAVVPNTAKSAATLDKEAMNRLMTNESTLIRTQDDLLTTTGYQKPLWRAHGNANNLSLRYVANTDAGSVTEVEAQAAPQGGSGSAIVSSLNHLNGLLSGAIDGVLDLNDESFYTATFSVDIRKDRYLGIPGESAGCAAQSTAIYMCASRSSSILADTWSAGSPDEVRDHTKKLVPMRMLGPITDLLSKAAGIGEVIGFNPVQDLQTLDDAPGYVVPDVVPADRLGQYQEEDRL
jgi:muconolactone delta-isomerase